MKYLYVIDEKKMESLFPFCYVPLDNYIFTYSEETFGIRKPQTAWSKWYDYQKDYMTYQDALRKTIKSETPLGWELDAWIKASKE